MNQTGVASTASRRQARRKREAAVGLIPSSADRVCMATSLSGAGRRGRLLCNVDDAIWPDADRVDADRRACRTVEGRAAREIEGGLVPRTGQRGAALPPADMALVERPAGVRAAVVERVDVSVEVEQGHLPVRSPTRLYGWTSMRRWNSRIVR